MFGTDQHIVYTTLHEDGNRHTYTPAPFREKSNWKNNPNQATLMALPDDTQTPNRDVLMSNQNNGFPGSPAGQTIGPLALTTIFGGRHPRPLAWARQMPGPLARKPA
jgi:hypothetical protein